MTKKEWEQLDREAEDVLHACAPCHEATPMALTFAGR